MAGTRPEEGVRVCSLFVLENPPNLGGKVAVCGTRDAPEASVVVGRCGSHARRSRKPLEQEGPEQGFGHFGGCFGQRQGLNLSSLARTGTCRGCANEAP